MNLIAWIALGIVACAYIGIVPYFGIKHGAVAVGLGVVILAMSPFILITFICLAILKPIVGLFQRGDGKVGTALGTRG